GPLLPLAVPGPSQGARSPQLSAPGRHRRDADDGLLPQDGWPRPDDAGGARRLRPDARVDGHDRPVKPHRRDGGNAAPHGSATRPPSMAPITIVCARCTLANHAAARFCTGCGLLLGSVQPDTEAASDALGTYEPPDPDDPDVNRLIRDLVSGSG